jgi:FHS family Na+ dependent glucose MFS transporter 1
MTTSTVSPASRTTVEGKNAKTVAYYAAFVALGLAVASLGPTLPGLAENTRTVLSEISYLFTARSLGYLLGSFQGGRLYDRMPGHPVMGVTLLIMAAMLVLVPFLSVLWLLTGVLLILGMAEGTLDVGGNTLLVWVHRARVGPYMNGLHFFFGVGAFLSPLIIAQAVLMSGDITWAYWALALLILPVGLWLLPMPSPKNLSISADSPVGQVNRLLVILVAVFFFLYAGAEVSFGGWIFTYAVALDLANATTAAYLTSAFWGALTLGRLLAIPIAARFRPRYILLADLLGSLVSLSIILIWNDSIGAVWLGTIGLGLSMASVFPATLTLAERRMTITGRVTGWFFVGASLGGMTLPWLIGQLFESVGPQVTMLILFADLIIALGVYTVLIRYSNRLQEVA